MSIKDQVRLGTGDEGWAIHTDGGPRYRSKIVVPRLASLRKEILGEFHYSRFDVHPSGMKMYHDLRRQHYWSGIKQQVEDFFSSVPHVSVGKS